MNLEPITYQQQEAHWQIVAFMAKAPLLLTGYSIDDAETWERIGRVEVVIANQFQALNVSRTALDVLNIAKEQPERSISLLETLWLQRTYGYALCSINAMVQLRLCSDINHSERSIKVETHGFMPPRDYKEVLKEGIDFNWFIQTQERIIPPFERFYRFHTQGIILRVLVESADRPFLTYGPGKRVQDEDGEPVEIAPGWWSFDLREGFGSDKAMFDTREIANTSVELPVPRGKQYSRVIVEQAIAMNWQ
jgi:hypothetical protein